MRKLSKQAKAANYDALARENSMHALLLVDHVRKTLLEIGTFSADGESFTLWLAPRALPLVMLVSSTGNVSTGELDNWLASETDTCNHIYTDYHVALREMLCQAQQRMERAYADKRALAYAQA